MWTRALTIAAASALLAGVAVGGAQARAGDVAAAARTQAESRVAESQEAWSADDELTRAAVSASAEAAARQVADQRAADIAARDTALAAAAQALEASAGAVDEGLRTQLGTAVTQTAAASTRHAPISTATASLVDLTGQVDAARQAWQVEQERIAAEKAAAEAAARAAARGSAPRAPARTGAPAGSSDAVAWKTRVVNSGGQDAVDACLGGLTRWYENVDGKPYYPIHRGCGGTPILGLHLGDRVRIDGGTWVVTDSRDVPSGATYDDAAGLGGQILLQTCYRGDGRMRIVALSAA